MKTINKTKVCEICGRLIPTQLDVHNYVKSMQYVSETRKNKLKREYVDKFCDMNCFNRQITDN
jgi:hypothetical protein